MASKKVVPQTSDLLREISTLDLQKQQASTELMSYTTLLASPAEAPVVVVDMANFINFSNLGDKLTVKHPYSNIPGDVRMQQKSGTKGPSSSGPSSSPTNTTQLIFPPFVQFQSNLRTLSLISGDVPPPSSAPSMVSEAAFISSYVVDTFTKLYSELLVYDPQESQLPIPAQLPYSLASFRVYTLVPFFLSRFKHYSVSVYFQGKDPSRDLLVASPLETLVPGVKEKSSTLFTALNIDKNPLYIPVTNYTRIEQGSESGTTGTADSTPTNDAESYYYHPHLVDVEAAGVKYRSTANWASVLAMGMDCMAVNPYSFLLTPFSSFVQISIPFDKSFTPDALQLFLQCTDKEVSPNMVTLIEFPTLFGVIRDRIRKHFLLSENQGAGVRSPLLHSLIDDLNKIDSPSPSQDSHRGSYRESMHKDDSSVDENTKRYSMNLGGDSFQATSSVKATSLTVKDTFASLYEPKPGVESTFLLDLFESVIQDEARLQTPLSLGVIDVLSMEKAEYKPKELFSKPPSRFLADENIPARSADSRPTILSRNACASGAAPRSLRSLLNSSDSSMNSSMMSADSSPFDALEEYNPDLIFVKLWVSDPVLAVILSDQFTDHEEDFLQTYATERQLKLYRMLEKKHPRKYNNGRYNVGSTEGASASGPIIIGMTATDMSTTQGGMGRGSYLGEAGHNCSLRNSGIGGNSGIPVSLQNNSVMLPHPTHGPTASIYTGKTSRTRMTAKEAAERRRLLKLERMRSKIYECNQNYLPGRKLTMYKDYDPANFPLGKPEAPWNSVNKGETAIDILKVDMATLRTMDRNELTVALDTQEKMMKTISLLPRLREASEAKAKRLPDKNSSVGSSIIDREASARSDKRCTHQESTKGQQPNDCLAPTPRLGDNLANSSQANPLTSLLDAPEVQIGSRIDEEEKPKKSKKSKYIRGYRVIDETEAYANKNHVYEQVHCDVGSEDSLFNDDQQRSTDMSYCVVRLTTLLDLASGALVLNLQQLPRSVCAYEPYIPEYPSLYGDAKIVGKRSPSTNKLGQAATKQIDLPESKTTMSVKESAHASQHQILFEAATTGRPVWRPKIISYDSSQSNADVKQQVKPSANAGSLAGGAKRPLEPAKQAALSQQECPLQQEDIESQADGVGSTLLPQSNILNTAAVSVIGEKDKTFLPTIKKIQTASMLPTLQLYHFTATLLRKNTKDVSLKQDTPSDVHGVSHDISPLHTSNVALPSLCINGVSQDGCSERSQQDPENLLLELCDPSPERLLKPRKIKSTGNIHWDLDNWLSSESLILTFNADYLPVVAQTSELTSQRDSSAICFMEVVFYFMQNERVFATQRRGLSVLTVDVIKEYCMNTRLPANISELDRYDLTLLFSISFHSVPVPHPMTLLARLEEASKTLEAVAPSATKPSSRSVSASSQGKGSATGVQEQNSSDYWMIDAVQESRFLLEKQLDVDLIEAKFSLDLLPFVQSSHGANVSISALQRYTGEVGIANLKLKSYDLTDQNQGSDPSEKVRQDQENHSPCLQVQSIVTQGVLTGMMGVVALFEIDTSGPHSARPVQTPIAVAPTNVSAPMSTQDQVDPSTGNEKPNTGADPAISFNISSRADHTILSKVSDTTFVRLIPCFRDGVPAGATIYIYALDDNSAILYKRVPICINGSLVQSVADLIIPTEHKTFIILEGYSIFQAATDLKSKTPSPSGLLPFKFSMITISDSYVDIQPLRINSNLFQLRSPLKLNGDDKSTVELKFSIPGGYCFAELGLVAIPCKPSKVDEQPNADVPPDVDNNVAPYNPMTDAPTTGEVYQSTEEDILPINIFHKPLLPVFETTQNAPRSKGSPQKKVAEEDVNVKVTTDIRDVLKDDATRMAECTTKLIPFLCSGCPLNSRRVCLINIPPSGVVALNVFVPEEVGMKYEEVSMHVQAFTFLGANDAPPAQTDAKGKLVDPVPNAISACQANLNEWILQRLCTSIWSRTRVLQGEELLTRASYLQSAASVLPQITTLSTYSFVPTDELVAYLEHKEDTDQAKANTADKDKKVKAPPPKKKDAEPVVKTAEPLELTLEGMQGQERDDLSTVIATEIQALQTFTVSVGAPASERKQPVVKKTDSKKDKNVPEPASTIIAAFKDKLVAPRTQAAIEYFDIEMVSKKHKNQG
ncbi:hypothetical protein GL50803_0041834 [Giardia duodenalis]|uniref:Uncharacterized protein n=1 Tax=Giardia intestinalis (strain ATCC 50803 / WB clone C6) TaxID=184922 RepID=A8BVJ9_GIAIC|nr:hypothetical protein GL50803_0041834 [Giardia intestinalis]KAE8304506.1 hypothetical protein GL50803_0041834 [Giardia intestinalis]|eukprot:XP_001704570.1 Hypothetical protein GL50803_41834 [Giardia lamblia ATCC 50803]